MLESSKFNGNSVLQRAYRLFLVREIIYMLFVIEKIKNFSSKKFLSAYILVNTTQRKDKKLNHILKYFPDKIEKKIAEEVLDKVDSLEEIRLRSQRPIILKFHDGEKIIKYTVTTEEILSCLQMICENSIYTYQNQISSGFITIKGGHRVGITGSCVIDEEKVININYIHSLNFRIARQIVGSSNQLLRYILNLEENSVFNTLLVAPPGAGKTTVLRDLIRQVSSGVKEMKFKAINVGVVDERGEIAALYKGIAQNDIGVKTDVIENVSKSVGIRMLIRSMAPRVVVADEIGNKDDIEAINYAMCSGCKGIFTAHGSTFEDIMLNPVLKNLLNLHVFEKVIFLDTAQKGNIQEVYQINKKNTTYEKVGDR